MSNIICNRMKHQVSLLTLATVMMSVILPAQAQEPQTAPAAADSLSTKASTEENRNVMLNASDASKPREIQIGLPAEDVSVYENGLPTVYSSALHKVSAHWRSDGSLENVDLVNPSESAITTGNIAYTINSNSHLGSDEFKGILNYRTNHFGLQQFDLTVSDAINKNWQYAASVYQDFDPGSFDTKFADYHDRAQIYKFALTRKLGDKGKLSFLYKYSYDKNLANIVTYAPFTYVGDGSVEEYPGFDLGTNSYTPRSGAIEYMDVRTGEMRQGDLTDFTLNKANEFGIKADYTFDNGIKWNLNAKYTDAKADYTDIIGSGIVNIQNGANTTNTGDANYYHLNGQPYSGYMDARRTWLHASYVKSALLTTDISKQSGNHFWRLGLNQWYYEVDYHSHSMQWFSEVKEYPEIIQFDNANGNNQSFYGFNELSPEYTKGYENKLALFFTDDWDVNDKFNLYYGGRLEYYRMDADQLPYDRFTGFHVGATSPDGQDITVQNTTKNQLNYAFTAQGTYRFNDKFGAQASATLTTRYPRISEYAGKGPSEEQYKKVTIPLLRAGVFYKNDWLNATSMVSYISKSNNIDQQNLTNPNNPAETRTCLLTYSIQTLGWTTSADIKPFKGAHLHLLYTYQQPKYNDYETSVTFADGKETTLNATDNIVKEIPEHIIEIDPSYQITPNVRLWASFRYFSKTYANLTNALYFNGRWETFAGVNVKVNKHLSLDANVINFLNQKGASGTIYGAELTTKDAAAAYNNHYMSGYFLRPLTFELSAHLTF